METTNTKPKRGRPRLDPEEKARRKHERQLKQGEKERAAAKTALDTQTLEAVQGKQLGKWGQEYVQPGDNSKYLRHALTTMQMEPIDIADPVQVENRIIWYFNHCGEYDMKPTVNGLCNALGIHRDTLHTWKVGQFRKGTHQEIVLRAYGVMEELWEDYMMNGKINPVSGIFLAKNLLHGYSDKQEFVLTPNQNQMEPEDIATIEAKYAELPED